MNNFTAFFHYYFPSPDFPDILPALTPAPPKKSKTKSASVHFEDEDPEERLDSHDQHITAVLSRIVVCLVLCDGLVVFFECCELSSGQE